MPTWMASVALIAGALLGGMALQDGIPGYGGTILVPVALLLIAGGGSLLFLALRKKRIMHETAIIWVPYSDELTKWSFIGTAITLSVIYMIYRKKR